jgi:hypothetical protein
MTSFSLGRVATYLTRSAMCTGVANSFDAAELRRGSSSPVPQYIVRRYRRL